MDTFLISQRVKTWAERQIERATITITAALLMHNEGVNSTSHAAEIARHIWQETGEANAK